MVFRCTQLIVHSGRRCAAVICRSSCSCSMPCKSLEKGYDLTKRRDARPLFTSCARFQNMMKQTPRGVDFSFDKSYLRGSWGGLEMVFPLVWLRYNCRCPNCMHQVSFGRKLLARDLQLSPQINDLYVDRFAQSISVRWSDDHESVFAFDWLKRRSFDEDSIARRRAELRDLDMRCAWGRSFRPAVMDFVQTLRTDQGLRKFIKSLKVHGLVILENAIGEEEPMNELESRFGYVTSTAYGPFFEVRSKAVSSNLAYTSETLGLHTDLAYYHEVPGIQMLHCVRQTADIEGGENQFADAMFVGRCLRREDNKAFQTLKEEKVNFWDYGSDFVSEFHLKASTPVLEVDDDDEVTKIVYNHQVQDSEMIIPANRVSEWFRAMTLLEKTLNEEAVHWRLEAGQIAVFDNTRVLHGRNGYRMTSLDSERYLRGAYLSWDLVNSLYRRLNERSE